MFETFVVIRMDFFTDGKENIDKGSHSKPALGRSERNMFVWYQLRD